MTQKKKRIENTQNWYYEILCIFIFSYIITKNNFCKQYLTLKKINSKKYIHDF